MTYFVSFIKFFVFWCMKFQV